MRTWDMPWHSAQGVTRLPSHTWVVTGRLRQRRRLTAGEAGHVRRLTSAPVKVTLIAPGFLGPQCGFASIAEGGNLLIPEAEFAKLRLVAGVARATWGPND
jgi:hypothetical protein